MDLRGRGRSGKPPSGYSIEHHCRDIRSLLEDIGDAKPVLVGHSLGAAIALGFGALYPDQVDRIILIDGGGKLSEEQKEKVFAGIKPSLDRLGKVFPSFEVYLSLMKMAPFLQPWPQALEASLLHELEEVDGGVRSSVQPEHIEEEILNLMKVDASQAYPKINCPVLILRAKEGMLVEDDILLPEKAIEIMIREIPDARVVDVEGTNHYSIIFQPNEVRDRAILDFLEE
jgi:pimeloyl-ACP methyl ester carboxylesterase